MGKIPDKPRNKLREFFANSKKLIQPPKALPEIKAQTTSTPLMVPPIPTKQPIKEQLTQEPTSHIESLKKDFKLPKIEPPSNISVIKEQVQPLPPRIIRSHDDDLKRFEEAISSINIDMIHSEAPAEAEAASLTKKEEHSYYKPTEMGEGYFSEIEHYIKNKDVNEILDDILKKDFLTGMKDYHDNKAQGKPFFLHKDDLRVKLKVKMDQLQKLEEAWHSIKTAVEEEEKKKKRVEQEIDEQSQELKDLFKQVKINQWLEQEAPEGHYFKLRSGQELKTLNDLRKALTYMTDEDFSHHVNQEKNDFATWTKEALQNQELYEKILNAKTKESLQALLQNPI